MTKVLCSECGSNRIKAWSFKRKENGGFFPEEGSRMVCITCGNEGTLETGEFYTNSRKIKIGEQEFA